MLYNRYKCYITVICPSLAIICATSSYYGKAWFSNISILMNSEESNDYQSDQGVSYGQVLNYLPIH